MMSADLLRRAADLIERRSNEATPAPWSWEAREDWGFGSWHTVAGADGQGVAEGGCEGGGVERKADAAWIVTVGPHIAGPLVDWLRLYADAYEQYPGPRGREAETNAAVQIARAILGEQP